MVKQRGSPRNLAVPEDWKGWPAVDVGFESSAGRIWGGTNTTQSLRDTAGRNQIAAETACQTRQGPEIPLHTLLRWLHSGQYVLLSCSNRMNSRPLQSLPCMLAHFRRGFPLQDEGADKKCLHLTEPLQNPGGMLPVHPSQSQSYSRKGGLHSAPAFGSQHPRVSY